MNQQAPVADAGVLSASPPLQGVTVLDFGGTPSAYTTRLLHILGADVIMVEPPGGSAIRREPPFVTSEFISAHFAHFCIGRSSICVDLDSVDGRDAIERLMQSVDVIVLDQSTNESMNVDTIEQLARKSTAIVARFRDFPSQSQFSEFLGSNLVDEAMSGLLALTGGVGRPPTQLGSSQTWYLMALHGTPPIVAALYDRMSGHAKREALVIEISAQEAAAMATVQHSNIHQYLWLGVVPKRAGAPVIEGDAGVPRLTMRFVECLDGLVSFGIPIPGDWNVFLAWLDALGEPIPERFHGVEYFDYSQRTSHQLDIHNFVNGIAKDRLRVDFCESAQAAGLLAMPVNTPGAILADPQLAARSALFRHPLSEVTGSEVLDLSFPFASTPPMHRIEPSLPGVGSDSARVLQELGGYTRAEIEVLLACGAIRVESRSIPGIAGER